MTKIPPPKYYIMDGRALADPASAMVLDCCSTIKECRESLKLFGDAVIFDTEKEEVIYL